MTAARLLEQFDRVAEAPRAVPRLRRFVLDLAVRGKLVEQDSRDEPASELLARIERLMPARTRVYAKSTSVSDDFEPSDEPFPLPLNWRWSCFGRVGIMSPRNTAPDDLMASFIPMALISADYGVLHRHEQRPWRQIKSGYTHVANGDVGVAKITPCFENGKSAIFSELTGRIGAATTELHVLRPILMPPEFILIVAKSPFFIDGGIPFMTGTAGQKRVPAAYFANTPVPVPPLREQIRIVARVAELMALCNQLEAARAKRESRRNSVVVASLADVFQQPASRPRRQLGRFVHARFGPLARTVEHIGALRQRIVDLALCGHLTAQTSTGESSDDFLRRIAGEAADLRAQHGVPTSVVAPLSEPPFPAPTGWCWARLASLFWVITDGDHLPPPKADTGTAFLTISNITTGRIDYSNCRYVKTAYFAALPDFKKPRPRDILYTIVGATLGRPAVVETDEQFCVQRHIAILKSTPSANISFLRLFLSSGIAYSQAVASATGSAQPTIPLRALRNFVVLVPQPEEQRRIVAKVEELTVLCDRLETQIIAGEALSSELLDALLREALTSPSPKLAHQSSP